jgi:molybdopterin converting factor small subunit
MEFRDPQKPAATLSIRVRLFARYAEVVGSESFTFELPHPSTVSDVVALMRARVPNGNLIPERPLVAVDLEHVRADRLVQDGEELALLPPVAGG